MIYKIAEFYFEADLFDRGKLFWSKNFECENAPHIDAKITVTKQDIDHEELLAKEAGEGIVGLRTYQSLAFYRKVCAKILKDDAFMMHGAVIEYEGKGYLFTAKSGTGKTTHIRLWKKLFGDDKVTIVNGDKPIIRFIDGKVYAYGTPWNGKEHYGTNGRVELSAICFLERGEENSIKKISDIEALPRIFSQIMIHDSADLAKQMELVDKLFEKVPTYLLECNMDIEAAKVAYEGMSGQGAEK